MNEQILYYGAWAAILELLFWAGLGVLALHRYRKRRASHVVIKPKPEVYSECLHPKYWGSTAAEYSTHSLNWQPDLKDFYTGEEE